MLSSWHFWLSMFEPHDLPSLGYPARPCSAHGTSGWFGLEEDPPSDDQETALHGRNEECINEMLAAKVA